MAINKLSAALPKSRDPDGCDSERRCGVKTIAIFFWSAFLLAGVVEAQGPSYPPYPSAPYQGGRPPMSSQQEMPSEYAFRPDLSNPEYGACLQLEKNWKALWHRYSQYYNQVRMMHPGDPQFGPATRYLQNMKMELDAAWNTFRNNCIYFPRSRRERQ
jgi:hypothetical protein